MRDTLAMSTAPTRSPYVLLVEDEQEIADLMRDFLEADGFRVAHALNGDEAITALAAGAPDCVLLDVMLPGLSGFELCRRIRGSSDVPVLFLSARDGDADKIRGLGLGADDYVVKSATPAEVVARIKAVLRRYRQPGNGRRGPLRFGRLEVDLAAREVIVAGAARAHDDARVRGAPGARRAPAAGLQPRAALRPRLGRATGIAAPSRSTSAACARRSRRLRPILATSSPCGASGYRFDGELA